MRQIFILLLLLVFHFQLVCQVLKPEQARRDLSVVRNALELRHPEIYRYISKTQFDSYCDSINQKLIRPISSQEFYLMLFPLISSVKCGHIKWLFPGKDYYYPFHQQNLFPLKLYFVGQQAFVIAAFSDAEIPSITEVLSINDLPVKQIITDLLSKLTFADGNTSTGKYYELNTFFPGIYSTHFGTTPQYRIEYLNKNGQVQKAELKGVTLESVKHYETTHLKEEARPFTFSLVGDKTGWMCITRFFSFGKEPNYHQYLKQTFKYLHYNHIETLVIDLRGNEGGNEKWGMELARYLFNEPFRYYEGFSALPPAKADFDESISIRYRLMRFFNRNPEYLNKGWTKTQYPEKFAFKGKIYILIDGQSYSTATEFASKFKSSARATIVGQESGGGYNLDTSGFFSIVKLPNSKIELGIPLIGFHMGNNLSKNPEDRGIIPDIEVEIKPEDILNQTDKIKKIALDKIEEERNKK